MPNHLQKESSPYLLQHAGNPVDWYPWGDEAFSKAKAEEKPVLLSIGYSACHWCHVMAHESFENPAIAALMNAQFVNIKVDREERPDIDSVYMSAVQALTGRGGWPLTVFLTPGGDPFYGGTYFPPEDKFGMPGFPRILAAVAEAYRTRKDDIEKTVSGLNEALVHVHIAEDKREVIEESLLTQAYNTISAYFDRENGGFGAAPKFPQPHLLEFLLRYYLRSGDAKALHMVEVTLTRMACGGIYDQLGGGFHRYSTDAQWLIPHFEKMLYDNALLSTLYLHAFQITGKTFYRSIVCETLGYVVREMKDICGGFYSAQDADSEGSEGRYYVWSVEEVEKALGVEASKSFKDYYHITLSGNFDGYTVLYRDRDNDKDGDNAQVEADHIDSLKRKLLKARMKRIRPARDEKVLSGWNGLMLSALAQAACVLDRKDYLQAALACGTFIYESMIKDGFLMHTWKNGKASVKGYLQDYALVIEAFLMLHQAALDPVWLTRALQLGASLVQQFYDVKDGILYDTGRDHQQLFIRPRQLNDDAMPGGLSSAVMALLKLAALTSDEQYVTIALRSLREIAGRAADMPMGFGYWLCALDFHLSDIAEIVLAGPAQNRQTQILARVLCRSWLPNRVVAVYDPAAEDCITGVPALNQKTLVGGKPAVYICRGHVCMEPVTEPERLNEMLR